MKRAAIALFVGFCLQSMAVAALPEFTLTPLGYTDGQFVGTNGELDSIVRSVNTAGHAAGQSTRQDIVPAPYQDIAPVAVAPITTWVWNGDRLTQVGLYDSEHTAVSMGVPYQANLSAYYPISSSGQAIGSANRFRIIRTCSSCWKETFSAWFYDGTATTRIGLTDALHTFNDGFWNYQSSTARALNENGQVIGYSLIFLDGPTYDVVAGETAWIYDGTNTTIIGLNDAEHLNEFGFAYNTPTYLNQAGQVIGTGINYHLDASGIFLRGRASSWYYDGTQTQRIGLIDGEHTTLSGGAETTLSGLADTGYAYGESERLGVAAGGTSVWVFDGTQTTHIGLVDTEHTQADGLRNSRIWPNSYDGNGQVLGTSDSYSGAPFPGKSAWIYDGTATVRIGLLDGSGAFDWSQPSSLNSVGHAIGISLTVGGQSVWFFDGVTTQAIGLAGGRYQNGAVSSSGILGLADNDSAFGYSTLYGNGVNIGQTSWIYKDGTTEVIGLGDALHTRSDGGQRIRATHFNEAGQVIGYSKRYDGIDEQGESGWFHDSETGQVFDLTLSTRSDGFAFSRPNFLSADGSVLGLYTLFDEFDVDLGQRAFFFSVEHGLFDLADLVNPADLVGWTLRLGSSTSSSEDLISILGTGTFEGQDNLPFALTAVPSAPGVTLGTSYVPQPGKVNRFYSWSGLSASGGQAPYTYSIISGSLPASLTLDSATGVITGVPTQVTTAFFTVQVTDANLSTATVDLKIRIKSSFTCTSCHSAERFQKPVGWAKGAAAE